MSLLRKVRVLVGALVHKPFMPRPEGVDLEQGSDASQEKATRAGRTTLETQGPEVRDEERVADLIAQQRQEEADQF
jgi:hypothetical protein